MRAASLPPAFSTRTPARVRGLCAAELGEEELRAKVAETRERLAELEQKLVITRQDLQQGKKRHTVNLTNETKYGITKFAQEVIKVADNLERASESVKPEDLEQDKELRKMHAGVEAVRKEMTEMFTKVGVERMSPLDKPFDPTCHEAMFAMNVPGKEPNIIFHVMEPGYTIRDRVLRAAKVGVTRAA